MVHACNVTKLYTRWNDIFVSCGMLQIKQKLIEVGLPVGGGKAAMVERHKRLALLDAASNDREVPVHRRELIRQVASWEVSEARGQKAAIEVSPAARERERER